MRTSLILLFVFGVAACQPEASIDAPAQAPARTVPVQPVVDVDQPDAATVARFAKAMTYARAAELSDVPLGEAMQTLGLSFRGAPYVAGTLDAPAEETLVVKLDGFDCVTFVETMMAMAEGVQTGDTSYAAFAERLEDLRYRDGAMSGYASRLHYFSDWIRDNAQRGNVENITAQLGGEPLPKTLDFMTTHRESYPRLASDSLFQRIQTVEAELANLTIYYVPQDRIAEVYDRLQAGDIIATATHIDGLDVTHTGLVYKAEGQTGLLHASLDDGVKVSPDLQSYVQNIKSQIGIIVARPLEEY